MRSGKELVGSFAILLVIQVLTSLVAIALLGRMSPAIERILEENVYSVEAVEAMAVALTATGPADPETRSAYDEALERANDNVTEEAERPILERLYALRARALAGDPDARRESAEALRDLGRVNREAMQAADEEAKRLGFAGAWAAAILGLVGLAASLLAIGRARRRIVAPLAEMARVVHAQEAGELHRRCTLPESSGPEPARVLMALNELYDRRDRDTAPIGPAANVDRALVLALLDARDEAIAVVDEGGELVAANARAEALLAGGGGARIREALRRVPGAPEDAAALPGIARVEPVRDSGARMCVLREPGRDEPRTSPRQTAR